MIEKQVLLMLSLYLILGVIVFFDFNIHHLVVRKFTEVKASSRAAGKGSGDTVDENLKKTSRRETNIISGLRLEQ